MKTMVRLIEKHMRPPLWFALLPLLGGLCACEGGSPARSLPEVRLAPAAAPLRPVSEHVLLAGMLGPDSVLLSVSAFRHFPERVRLSGLLLYLGPSPRLATLQGRTDSLQQWHLALNAAPAVQLVARQNEDNSLEGTFTPNNMPPVPCHLAPANERQAALFASQNAALLARALGQAKERQSIKIGVHPSLPEYKLVFVLQKESAVSARTYLRQLYIVNDSTGRPEQCFYLGEAQAIASHEGPEVFAALKKRVRLLDLNADTYADLQILMRDASANHSPAQDHYLLLAYNPLQKSFDSLGIWANPRIDAPKGLQEAFWRLGPGAHEYVKVRFEAAQFYEVESSHRLHSAPTPVKVLYRWAGNDWKEVKTTEIRAKKQR